MTARRILVTSALPYANGHIHIGHLVEYIQTDIWVRYQRLAGNECIYLCADDTHGTAIMIRARQEGRTEAEVIADMHAAHTRDFADFQIQFDHYGSTNSPANQALCNEIWAKIVAAGLVSEREIAQLYDPEVKAFLADRFVKGNCPKCNSPDQYGDSCDKCGHTYDATELLNPRSTLSGATPVLRDANHYFIGIEALHEFLAEWATTGDHLQPEIANYLKAQFLAAPLRPWDVSRPAVYFGFPIPGTNEQHYWYVWFDAPIGYIAATQEWCAAHGQSLDRWWRDPTTEIHHFIGKDITYFHTLFWPAMLKTAELNLPTKVHIHGFLTVNGEKMAKTKGTFIRARTYLDHLDPAYLRYYYAGKLTPNVDDLDLNVDELVDKVNADLVGKVVNLASRTAKFVQATGLSATYPDDGGLFAAAAAEGANIAAAYEACDYNKATRSIMVLADAANRYVDQHEPWKLAKDPSAAKTLQNVCTVSLNLFRQIAIYLAPILPQLAEQTGALFGQAITRFDQSQTPLVGQPVNAFSHMMKRVDAKQVQKMVEASRESAADVKTQPPAEAGATPAAAATKAAAPASAAAAAAAEGETASAVEGAESLVKEPLVAEIIAFEDFAKVDLRVARVLSAEIVPKSSKLLKLSVTLGEPEPRTIFAGIQGVYRPEDLVGQLVVVVANLAPRKMPSGVSQGMVVAAGPGGKDIFVLRPDTGAQPGQRVH